VIDNGRGIPVDNMDIDGEKIPAAQVVMTTLHAGGKFRQQLLQSFGRPARRRRGCVNALSENSIWKSGATVSLEQTYSRASPPVNSRKREPARSAAPASTSFRQDDFHRTEYNFDTLSQRLRELAFLNKGLVITLTDERQTDSKTGEAKRAEFKYTGGIVDSSSTSIAASPFCTTSPSTWKPTKITCTSKSACNITSLLESVFSFANNINTVDGGTHLSGFRTSLTRTSIRPAADGLFKDVKENLTGDDVAKRLWR